MGELAWMYFFYGIANDPETGNFLAVGQAAGYIAIARRDGHVYGGYVVPFVG
jgi:hypothetical protein